MERGQFEEIKQYAKRVDSSTKKFFGYYGYVSNNGWKMEKEDLIDIIKELDFAVHHEVDTDAYNEIIASTLEELEEMTVGEKNNEKIQNCK